jgi:translation initiation factor 2 gamma subunit (eIF-2gamma)
VILEKGENYMDMVCETIVKNIHIPPRILEKPPVMIILKSGDDYSKNSNSRRRLVVHGVLLQGMLMPNCEMQISPGIVFQEKGTLKHSPLVVETDLIYAEETQLQFAQPGGIIKLYLTTGCTELVDSLAGHYLGEKGNLPGVFTAFRVRFMNTCLLVFLL